MGKIMDDRTLLDRYLASHDEGAFRELVGRHLDFVHAVARRVTGNDELARDAAQVTFVKLARDAGRVPRTLSLNAWLHRISRCAAIDLVRSEDRRRKREEFAHQHHAMNTPPEPEWERLAPVIDEAVDSLPASDRELVLAKYYRNESFAGIAARLGWTEANARKRASRSLEKLRHLLVRRGHTTTAAALTTALPSHALPPAPASLAGKVLAATAEIAPAPALGLHLAMTTAQKTTAAAAALAVFASGWAGHAAGSSRPPQHQSPALASGNMLPETTSANLMAVSAISSTSRETEDPIHAFRELVAGRRPDPWPVVSRLPVARIPGLLGELHDSWSRYPAMSAQATWLVEIESALLCRWAEVDPRAAFDDVRTIIKNQPRGSVSRGSELAEAVLAIWVQRDPDAAYEAVMGDATISSLTIDTILRSWTPETLERNLSRHPEDRGRLLLPYCALVGKSGGPAREAMLARLQNEPDMPDRDAVARELFNAWAVVDADAALKRAEALGLSNAVEAIFASAFTQSPDQLLPAAVDRGILPGSASWRDQYGSWLSVDAAAARSWFARTADVWTGQGQHGMVAEFLAAELIHLRRRLVSDPAGIKEATRRLEQSLARWKREDPEAAATWIEQASPKLGLTFDEP